MKPLNRTVILHLLVFILIFIFSTHRWPYSLLTVAQIVFVPIMLHLLSQKGDWFQKYYYFFAIPVYLAVAVLQVTGNTYLDPFLAFIYLLFTLVIALYGWTRWLKVGFTNIEECMMNIGMVYLVIGGGWFFAYEANINTGFSPLITWLTAIHFHYSAFLLPVFTGLVGRLFKPKYFPWICFIILLSPWTVALGIVFTGIIEVVSVAFYIIGIYSLIYLVFTTPFSHRFQKILVSIAFGSLGLTILFSLLYALGNTLASWDVSMSFMLIFHGFINCVIFAGVGVIGWIIAPPLSNVPSWEFPISSIRGNFIVGEKIVKKFKSNHHFYSGLVDDMKSYESDINTTTLSPLIKEFYEHTTDFELLARVRWKKWFIPLAAIYRLFSRKVQQINLPLHNKWVKMDGTIVAIDQTMDGRKNPRAWVRKINDEVVFTALYSEHQTDNKTYMNIALPLPGSTMLGILDLQQQGSNLILTSRSDGKSDVGIYLAGKHFFMKLPFSEHFYVKQTSENQLEAYHTMWVFGLPFLNIDYEIRKG